jgi:hypothetical protein
MSRFSSSAAILAFLAEIAGISALGAFLNLSTKSNGVPARPNKRELASRLGGACCDRQQERA